MAKKIARKSVKALKELEKVKARKEKNKVPYILVFIAALFLLVNGLTVILLNKEFAALLNLYAEEAVTSAGSLVTLGIIWIVLGILAWITVHEVKKSDSRSQKWFLFILGILGLISGRLEAGVLVIIASVLYLIKKI